MVLRSFDPHTGGLLNEFAVQTAFEVESALTRAVAVHREWKNLRPYVRAEVLNRLGGLFRRDAGELALLMASEMGKPIRQGLAEIEKCAVCCAYYAEHAEQFLLPRPLPVGGAGTEVRREPFGVWLAIMPWNYPFWQVIRCLIPACAAGNTVVLKHASNVTGCAIKLGEMVLEAAGLPLLEVLRLPSERMAGVISHPNIKGISFTGSERAGSQIAALAGAHIRPVVLELGGSNALIVMKDASLQQAATDAITGRFQNSGQSCIAAKRILVHEDLQEAFVHVFNEKMKELVIGNPRDELTDIGPLAQREFCQTLHDQVVRSISSGATLWNGGTHHEAYFQPTLLVNCTAQMPCMQEELFGPVAVISTFRSVEEAISISNSTRYGLGVSIYTGDPDTAAGLADQFEEGAVFINSIVFSDPAMPFGGVKQSGYGRELSIEGMLQLTNNKTLYIKRQSIS
jgi:acyl-CoA reductase-like NAD-dependent aldehyde dehydrogenase